MNTKITYQLDIETDEYAGNFDRELCAYITGQIGDCKVGSFDAEIFYKYYGEYLDYFEDIIEQIPDHNETYRPCVANNNTVEIYFNKLPSYDMTKIMIILAQEYAKFHNFKILSIKFFEQILKK